MFGDQIQREAGRKRHGAAGYPRAASVVGEPRKHSGDEPTSGVHKAIGHEWSSQVGARAEVSQFVFGDSDVSKSRDPQDSNCDSEHIRVTPGLVRRFSHGNASTVARIPAEARP